MRIFDFVVLILEVLFYSLFMKYSKKEGKLIRYVFVFIISSILVALLRNYFPAYLLFIFSSYIGLKYIVRIKPSLYDVLVIIVMLLLNVTIELPIYLIFFKLFHFNRDIVTIMFELVKLFVVMIGKKCFDENYLKFKNVWDHNDFNLRYGFTIMLYLYVIVTIALKIFTIFKG